MFMIISDKERTLLRVSASAAENSSAIQNGSFAIPSFNEIYFCPEAEHEEIHPGKRFHTRPLMPTQNVTEYPGGGNF